MHYEIVTLPGDGIGPEVVAEGVKVLHAVGARCNHEFTLHEELIGGIAIDTTGDPLPAATLARCQHSHAVLLGAVGGPQWDNPNAEVRPEQGLLGIRKALGLFANLRPVTLDANTIHSSPLRPERLHGVDMLVVRELTGGIYFGEKQRDRNADGEWASDLCAYTEAEIVRVVRVAANAARQRRGKLTLVDKANVLETSRLWRSVTTRLMHEEFPDITFDVMLVDACAMHLLRRPADFDVIVTENMFGDILTDEAAMLAGSMGMLPSASLGAQPANSATRPGLYEPIHGSAPDIAGQHKANPLATILSIALLLRYSLGLATEAALVEAAVRATLTDGVITADIAQPHQPVSLTNQVGDAVVGYVNELPLP